MYQNIMRDKTLTPEAKAIYAYLCSFAGSGDSCYPGAELMRLELGMGSDRFYKHMKLLTDSGVVNKEQERSGNRWGKALYKLNHMPDFPHTQIRCTQNQDTHLQNTENRSTNNNSFKSNSTKSNSNKYGPEFEEFWKIYPRKVDKGQAYKTYKARIKDGFSPDDLKAAAESYRRQCEREHTEQKYIKHAKTFLGTNLSFTEYIPKKTEADQQRPGGVTSVLGANPFRRSGSNTQM